MHEDRIKVSGSVFLDVIGPDGEVKDHRELKNTVTAVGLDYIVDALNQNESGRMRYIGIGTGDTAAATGNTALENEVGTRGSGTITDGGSTYQVEYTFASGNPATGGYAIRETGLFCTTGGVTMGARQVFATVTKATADALKVTWRWVFS